MLLAYPRSFRECYGAELVRTVDDMRRYEGMSRPRVALHVARDVARTAPRLRIEAIVTETKTLAILALVVLTPLAAIAGSPRFVLVLLVPLVVLGSLVHGHDRAIRTAMRSRHWWRWGLGGAALLGMLIVAEGAGPDFDWLPGAWFLLWFLVLMALALVCISVVLGTAQLIARGRRQLGEPPAI
jgi:hypothetical protein